MKPLNVYHEREPRPDTRIPDPHQDTYSKTVLGFWIYLMTDCILFATLFATHAVLHNQTFGGPTSRELFSLPFVFVETMLLLCSSVTCGFAMLASVKNHKNLVLMWLLATFILGASFITMELIEFNGLIAEGNSWKRSAFLSSFFSLVGTHGLHVTVGLYWMLVMMAQLFFLGITVDTFRRLTVFSMFWHFLDVVWIFIFTFVYLRGAI
jgi:cytochrome o ubiquinol oxidase subunit 3